MGWIERCETMKNGPVLPERGALTVSGNKFEIHAGDIFTIPLFLPSYQKWRRLDELIDYRKYKFHHDDIFAFGRLIEHQTGNMELIEVFSYTGTIPETPEVILRSGRLFDPVMMVGAFTRGRWRFLFDDPHYDKWADSGYAEISFMLGMGTTLWKGGEQTRVSLEQGKMLKRSGVLDMVVHGSVGLEVQIRSLLAERGLALRYEETVEARRNEYPQPRDPDKKLKETIAPFRWLSDPGCYTLCLDAGLLGSDSFAKHKMPGSGYDWEKVASAYLNVRFPSLRGKFTFDCESDLFSMRSKTKKPLRDFALAFHNAVSDTDAFEELLCRI